LRRRRYGQAKIEAKWGILLALPVIIGFFLWTVGPTIASFILSLTRWPTAGSPEFIGLGNYIQMFGRDYLFKKSLGVTTYYAFGSIPLVIIAAFIVAMLLNQKVRGQSIFRTMYYLPSVVPTVASALLWLWLFNPNFGLLNYILSMFGLPQLMWIYDETQVVPSFIIMSIWAMGGTMLIFLAGLQGIPNSLFEAIEIDGGNWWAKFRNITVPMMTPVIFFNLVMGIIGSFQIFNQAYIMTDGGPNNASLFFVYYLYLNAFRYGKMGYACALAWILFLAILALTLIVFKSSSYWVFYEMKKGK
jgi:multiple sugar transport system permease protein